MVSITGLSEHCRPLAHPFWPTTALAAVLVVGILVSYVPQHLKIIQRRTSEGLSPWWVLMGGLSSIAAIGNILTLPTSRSDMVCCRELSGSACGAALLGVAQIAVQWSCFMIIVMLYLIFFPTRERLDNRDLSSSTASLTQPKSLLSRRDPIIVACSIFGSVLLVLGISVVLVFRYPAHAQLWADILGTIAGFLAAVQYLPQIYYTWILGDMKSLSVLTLTIQAPGSFIFAFSLALRVGVSGWSTWLVYIVTGSLQFVLLAMAISYWNKDRLREQQKNAAAESVDQNGFANGAAADERTSLLSSTRDRGAGT